MKLRVYQNLQDLDEIAENWNALVAESASHVPFLRYEYLSTWWKTLGGGEWDQGELYVVVATDAVDRLVGIAPLFLTENLDGKTALMFLGSIEISDYLDVIVRQADLEGFVEALLTHLSGVDAPAWEVVDLYNILDDSPTLEIFKAAAPRFGLELQEEKLHPAPCVALPDRWEDYLAALDKKQRHELRRKIRRVERAEEEVRWYIVEDEAQLDDEIDAFLQLMALDSNKEAFLTDVMRTQMRAAVHAAFRAGWLQLAFMEIGGKKAAAYLNFDYANRIMLYNSGFDFDFSYYSPGWVLIGYLIEWAIEHGREAFDFMRGDEQYKYRLGGVDRFVLRAQLTR